MQFGPTSKELSALSILAQQMISEPFFDVLRTKEQLGYVVNASQRSANGTEVRNPNRFSAHRFHVLICLPYTIAVCHCRALNSLYRATLRLRNSIRVYSAF